MQKSCKRKQHQISSTLFHSSPMEYDRTRWSWPSRLDYWSLLTLTFTSSNCACCASARCSLSLRSIGLAFFSLIFSNMNPTTISANVSRASLVMTGVCQLSVTSFLLVYESILFFFGKRKRKSELRNSNHRIKPKTISTLLRSYKRK